MDFCFGTNLWFIQRPIHTALSLGFVRLRNIAFHPLVTIQFLNSLYTMVKRKSIKHLLRILELILLLRILVSLLKLVDLPQIDLFFSIERSEKAIFERRSRKTLTAKPTGQGELLEKAFRKSTKRVS